VKISRYAKICLSLAVAGFSTSIPAYAADCAGLSTLKLPDTTITSAQEVAAGALTPPAGLPPAMAKALPAFCRVQASIKPAKDSDIKIEVWLPLTGWNGKYRAQGNGGFAGDIFYFSIAPDLAAGYAVASTDTGHTGSPIDAGWALGHPDRIVDFGWRAIHEMTVKAKAIIQAFYGNAPKHSYFNGCSNGGRQGLMEAQRFPDDYDGIVAGAPANYWTKVFATFIFDIQATQATPGSYITADKVPAVAKAVNAACDAQDGVSDGVLNDPRACRFDPKTLVCKGADSPDCISAAQATTLQKIYDGPHDAAGKLMFPGFLPGGEDGPGGWVTWIGQGPGKDLQTAFANGFFTNMITVKDPLDVKTVKVEAAVKLADEQQARTFNADDPNLKAFAARGGKLIMYHGWSDAALPPQASINYFESVQAALGAPKTAEFMRLFMIPGMQHCAGGPGAGSMGQYLPPPTDPQHNVQAALDLWVEKGIPPDKLIGTKFVDAEDPGKGVKMTRPLCAYPQFAKYKGTGDTNDAANFECKTPIYVPTKAEQRKLTMPRALYTPNPEYPTDARVSDGIVVLSAVIGLDGRTHDIRLIRSLGQELDAKAIEAAERWKFAPALKGKEPVAVEMNLEVAFDQYR